MWKFGIKWKCAWKQEGRTVTKEKYNDHENYIPKTRKQKNSEADEIKIWKCGEQNTIQERTTCNIAEWVNGHFGSAEAAEKSTEIDEKGSRTRKINKVVIWNWKMKR